jgi:Tfp pilus assembly protein FimT
MKVRANAMEEGFSLLELLVVFLVLSVVVTFAVTQFGGTQSQVQTQNVVRSLKVHLERARFDSVKRNARTTSTESAVRLTGPTAFQALIDRNQNGSLESSEIETVDMGLNNAARIVGAFNYPVTIRFDQRGRISAVDSIGQSINPTFTLCGQNCDLGSVTPQNASVITITPSGTVVMLRGGESLATVSAPNVSSISPSNNIRCSAFVRTSSNSSLCQSILTGP